MEHNAFLKHLQTLVGHARHHENAVQWIEHNIGKGLSFGEDVRDKSDKIIFSIKGTPARSPQRLLACLLMQILTANQNFDNLEE